MTIFDVGAENLPNIYIDHINMHDQLPSGDYGAMDVTFLIKDHYSQRSWSGEKQLFNKIKLKVLLVYCGEGESAITEYESITTTLNNGLVFDQYVKGQISAINALTKGYIGAGFNESTNVDLDKDLVTFEKTLSFDIRIDPAKKQGLSIYACCYYDFDDDFSNPIFAKFNGPVVSEKIMINGSLNTNSGYFYFPNTNQTYGGPVHYHDQGYMQGSEHRDEPHETLMFVASSDFKIKGQDIVPLPVKVPMQNYTQPDRSNYCGVHVATQTGDDSVISLCFINAKLAVLANSSVAENLYKNNPSLFNSIAESNISIKNIGILSCSPTWIQDGSLINSVVSKNFTNNTLGGVVQNRRFMDSRGNLNVPREVDEAFIVSDILAHDNENSYWEGSSAQLTQRDYDNSTFLSSIHEVSFLQNEGVRTFVFKDSLLDTAAHFGGRSEFTTPTIEGSADARYQALFTIENNFDLYITQKLTNLSSAVEFISTMGSNIETQDLYDYDIKKYKKSYKQSVAESLGLDVSEPNYINLDMQGVQNSIYMDIARWYTEGFDLIQPAVVNVTEQVFKAIFPFTGSPQQLEQLRDKIHILMEMIRTEYNHSGAPTSVEENAQTALLRSFTVGSPKSNNLPLHDVSLAYKIFSRTTPTNTIHVLSKEQLRNRANYESKYYGNMTAPGSTLNSLSNVIRNNFLNIDSTRMNHFTPFGIKNENEVIDLTIPIQMIDSYKVLIFRLKKYGTLRDTSIETSGQNSQAGRLEVGGTVIDFVGTGTEDQVSSFTLDFGSFGSANVPFEVKLLEQFSSDFPLSEDELIISNSNSKIYQAAIANNALDLKDVPPHYKAMMLNNYGHEDYDVLANTSLRRVIAETQMNVFKIFCIVGFSSSNGYLNLTLPKTQVLSDSILSSNSPYFCYSEPVNLRPYGFFNDSFSIPTVDNFIYLDGIVTVPTGQRESLPDPDLHGLFTFDDNISYYTSNVVKQDPMKNGVLFLFKAMQQTVQAQNQSTGTATSVTTTGVTAPTNQTGGY
tara:strand:- start:3717 stop:6764 length:3048 start_codon:yes stop_codon:yes gene_type:complete